METANEYERLKEEAERLRAELTSFDLDALSMQKKGKKETCSPEILYLLIFER